MLFYQLSLSVVHLLTTEDEQLAIDENFLYTILTINQFTILNACRRLRVIYAHWDAAATRS